MPLIDLSGGFEAWRQARRAQGSAIKNAERDGAHVFDHEILTYPERMAAAGMKLTLSGVGEPPDHDAGAPPYTAPAAAACATFFAEPAWRFPAVDVVEMGNEMNSEIFIEGPDRDADINGRAGDYSALLKATHTAVREPRPGLRILGSAAHSMPLIWFGAPSADGAAALGSRPLLDLPSKRALFDGVHNRAAANLVADFVARRDTPETLYHPQLGADLLAGDLSRVETRLAAHGAPCP